MQLEKGFYYHYKHDPNGPDNKNAYYVSGVGFHTETEEWQVIYWPLYEDAFSYEKAQAPYVRPLTMFMEEVEKDGKRIPRFTKITDPDVLAYLEEKRKAMYSEATRG